MSLDLDFLISGLNLKYYQNILNYLKKQESTNDIDLEWLKNYISELYTPISPIKNIESEQKNESTLSSETENHKQIFSDETLYKKPWVKLNLIHKILKIKEFVNNLKFDLEKDRQELRDKLVELVKMKILTKKEEIEYDCVNGRIITILRLQYKNNKYHFGE